MRTAEEILRSVYNEDDSQEDNLQLAITLNPSLDLIKQAINEARIEAIKECAEIARCKPMVIQDDFELAPPSTYYSEVDKQSILKLIDQIK